MLIISLLGPIVSSISCLFLSRWLGSNVLSVVLSLYVLSCLTSLTQLYTTVINDSSVCIDLSNWSSVLGINISITLDLINSSLLAVVLTIGTCVISYTLYYMATDASLYRFVGLLSLFVSFMALLAIGTNLVVLFIGWELIGLFSYLLIGFWSDRTDASTAALSAMLTNKLGDYLLTVGLIVTYSTLSSLDILTINTVTSHYNTVSNGVALYDMIGLLAICYLIAAMAKSAQIGLHLWLIHAMQGPTPVSSLLHAATLVVAGPILLFKVSSLVGYHLSLIVTIGIVTSLLGASLALIQQDIKGTIAYSTMSQFGYIISIAALSAQSVANLHITTHAAFKACLFMAAGVVIHSTYDIQDNRRYGGLLKLLPVAYIGTLLCTLSLIAVPYTAGNASKDLILEVHSSQYTIAHDLGFAIGTLVAAITALYSVKLLVMTYLSSVNLSNGVYEKIHGANAYAIVPILFLSVVAVVAGYFGVPMLIDSYGYFDSLIIAELYNLSIRPVPVLFVLAGIVLAIAWSVTGYSLDGILYRGLALRLYWPSINSGLYYAYLSLGSRASKLVDLGLLELVGPHGSYKLFDVRP